jgi:hypothetical protein
MVYGVSVKRHDISKIMAGGNNGGIKHRAYGMASRHGMA